MTVRFTASMLIESFGGVPYDISGGRLPVLHLEL